jgi:hypothetical protein
MFRQPTPHTGDHPSHALSGPILTRSNSVAGKKPGQFAESPVSTKASAETGPGLPSVTPGAHDDLARMGLVPNGIGCGGKGERRELSRIALLKDSTTRNVDEESRHISLVSE